MKNNETLKKNDFFLFHLLVARVDYCYNLDTLTAVHYEYYYYYYFVDFDMNFDSDIVAVYVQRELLRLLRLFLFLGFAKIGFKCLSPKGKPQKNILNLN